VPQGIYEIISRQRQQEATREFDKANRRAGAASLAPKRAASNGR